MSWLRETLGDLAGLVLPATCAACGADSRTPVCSSCAATLAAARPGPAVPTPAPVGLPPCVTLAPYDGVLRELVLAYKERGRHDLARPLGRLLASVVATGPPGRLALVPVPATRAAARQRFGDHMALLAGHAARALGAAGWSVTVCDALRALPRPDSAGLDTQARAIAAAQTFRVRPTARFALSRATVVLLDDIITTGATLAAVAGRLADAGVPVARAAVLAATQRRMIYTETPPVAPPGRICPEMVLKTRGDAETNRR